MAKNKKTHVGSSAFKAFPIMAALAVGQVVVGGIKALSGASARDDARRKEKDARIEAEKYLEQYKDFDPRVQSPYEDLTVNLEQAKFMKQQQAQQSADTLYQLRQAGGSGAGLASLATAMSRQGAINAQKAAVSIGVQERRNQLTQKQFEASEARRVQQFDLQRIQNLGSMQYGIATQQAQAAQLAQQQMMGGIGDAIGGVADFAGAGGFGGGGGGSTKYTLAPGQTMESSPLGPYQSPAEGQFNDVNYLDPFDDSMQGQDDLPYNPDSV